MAPTVKTKQQLLDLFVFNDIGAIVPPDDQDFISSTFGYFVLPRDPSPLDDKNNSGGAGAYFDTGSRWMNTTTGQWFKCYSGAVGAAVWAGQAYDGEEMGGRLTGTLPNPVLTPTGVVPGTYGDASNYAAFTVQADGTITAAAQFPAGGGGAVLPGPGIRVDASGSDFIVSDLPGQSYPTFCTTFLNNVDCYLTNLSIPGLPVLPNHSFIASFFFRTNFPGQTCLMVTGGDNSGMSWYVQLVSSSVRFSVTTSAGGASSPCSVPLSGAGVWHHVLVWYHYDPVTPTQSIMLDGATVDTQNVTWSVHPSNGITLGCQFFGGTYSLPYRGDMAEFFISDEPAGFALDATLWNDGCGYLYDQLPCQFNGILFQYWPLEEDAGQPAVDLLNGTVLSQGAVLTARGNGICGMRIGCTGPPGPASTITVVEVPADPAPPPAGNIYLYAIGGIFYYRLSTGAINPLSGGGIPFTGLGLLNTGANQSFLAGVQDAINWQDSITDPTLFDTDAYYDLSHPTRITPPVSGFFTFHAKVLFTAAAFTDYHTQLQLLVNGGTSQIGLDSGALISNPGSGAEASLEFTSLAFQMNGGDYLELWFASSVAVHLHGYEAQFQRVG